MEQRKLRVSPQRVIIPFICLTKDTLKLETEKRELSMFVFLSAETALCWQCARCNEKLTVAVTDLVNVLNRCSDDNGNKTEQSCSEGKKLLCIKAKAADTLACLPELLLSQAQPKTWEDYKLLIRWNQSAEGPLLSFPACFVSRGLG